MPAVVLAPDMLAPDIWVNTVDTGLLVNCWGEGFSAERLETMSQTALFKKHPDIGDTAAAFVMLARNGSISGQTIVVDTGLLNA